MLNQQNNVINFAWILTTVSIGPSQKVLRSTYFLNNTIQFLYLLLICFNHVSRCWLKDRVIEINKNNRDCISGPKHCPGCFNFGTGLRGHPLYVNGYSSLKTQDALECQNKCKKFIGCNYFSYNTVTDRCYLKKRQYKIDNPSAISGNTTCPTGTFRIN